MEEKPTQGLVTRILLESARQVELRIAIFRTVLAVLLLGMNVNVLGEAAGGAPPPTFWLLVLGTTVALCFSGVTYLYLKRRPGSVKNLTLCSIGVDAILLSLPVLTYFAVPQDDSLMVLQLSGVPGLYMLVIASGMRFSSGTRFGVAVNTGVLLCYMGLDLTRLQETVNPDFTHLRHHVMLLFASVLLANLIQSQTRQTVLEGARTALEATVDGLTGVWNRRYLRNQLEQCTQRPESVQSIIMVDVDHFKQVNDTHGHQVGDQVLVDLAQVLQDSCRLEDSVARYGGEEFCLILQADLETARTVGERIREKVEASSLGGLKVTLSAGVAEFRPEQTVSEWLEEADQALYQAKMKGRNRVVTASREQTAGAS